ncbi:putative kinase-like protein TMKL1 [Punica granatum]|uniref:Protein kinase domain-containing protein n=2 Tax=Punica granatum TaxID=22663 RepID=A0A218X3C7_PUNGR|nr:putative kinase-like protein TMKL1 [Punica granatum]OWM79433.1 hypothetical protein CDL15_Pgr022845 [Punica granatum]PKI39446.1 hypothetical protein CRG98_040122 [Punica granatum]
MRLALYLSVAAIAIIIIALTVVFFLLFRKRASTGASGRARDIENSKRNREEEDEEQEEEEEEEEEKELYEEDLITFQGGEGLTICDILEAPGEVIGKSKYGTLYRAELHRVGSVKLLRFLRPACAAPDDDLASAVDVLGRIRHSNLVPLLGFYAGPRGEKLLVHPFCGFGNLAEFIRDGDGEWLKWSIIYRISIGITKGLDHLHTGLAQVVVHGNLKSKNVFLDRNHRPYISDFGMHLLLNPDTGQQMLETLAAQGYKAPELIKARDATKESDIYSLGIIFLELLTGREPVNEKAAPDEEPYLPNYVREAVLQQSISDLYHPNLLSRRKRDRDGDDIDSFVVTEECILKFFQLAVACCSRSPSLRPDTRQVLRKLSEIVK